MEERPVSDSITPKSAERSRKMVSPQIITAYVFRSFPETEWRELLNFVCTEILRFSMQIVSNLNFLFSLFPPFFLKQMITQ